MALSATSNVKQPPYRGHPGDVRFPSRGVSATLPPLYSVEVSQFFDRLFVLPNIASASIYQTFIDGLVADGIWENLDGLFVECAEDAITSLVDLTPKNSIPHFFTQAGFLPSFTDRAGWSTANLSSVQLGFKPFSDGVNFQQNNHSIFVFVSASLSSTNGAPFYSTLPTDSATQDLLFWLNYALVSSSSAWASLSPRLSPETGFFLIQRTSANAVAIYRNGTLINSVSPVSQTLSDNQLSLNGFGSTTRLIGYGKSLDSAKRTALNSRVQTLLAAVDSLP